VKKIAILLIVLMVVSVGLLSGCNELTRDKRFVGTWKGSGIILGIKYDVGLTYLSNGTYSIGLTVLGATTPESGSWEIKDNKLVLTNDQGMKTYNYVFSNNDNSLILTSTTIDLRFELIKQ